MRIGIVALLVVALAGCVGGVRPDASPELIAKREASQARPDDPQARLEWAQASLAEFVRTRREGYRTDAIDALRRLRESHPDYFAATALLYRGLSARAMEQRDEASAAEAAEVYRSSSELRDLPLAPPSQLRALLDLAKVRRVEDLAAVRRAVHAVIQEKPQFIGSRLLLARLYQLEGRHELAINPLREAAELEPENPVVRVHLAAAYKARAEQGGCIADATEDLKSALEALRVATKSNPDFALPQAELARVYGYLNRPKLALFSAQRATELAQGQPALEILAWVQNINGMDVKAESTYRRLLQRDPEDVNALIFLGWKHLLGDDAQVDESIRLAAQIREVTGGRNFYAWVLEGLARWRQAGEDEAQAFFASVPPEEDPLAWENHLLRFFQGRQRQAELISKAKSSCQRVEAYFYAGFVRYVQHKDIEGARRLFRKTLELERITHIEHAVARRWLAQHGG